MSKNITNTDSIIELLSQEIKFYDEYDNDNWSEDMNNGFKYGLLYVKDLIIKAKDVLDDEVEA